jgi:hypothetical protein
VPPVGYRHAPATRDLAIERVRRLSRWLAAGAVLVTGALVGVAAHEFPGHVTAGTGAAPATPTTPVPTPVPTTTPAAPTTPSGLGQPRSTPTTSPPAAKPRIHASTGAS